MRVHIPDGFLDARVALATTFAGAGALGVALARERREPRQVPAGVLGALAAFVFAAQMVNVPVAAGTSGHLVGATLVALLVGPWRAVIVMAAVLAVQALLLQDGGLTALGANLLDMGVAGAFVGAAVTAALARAVGGLRGVVVGAAVGGFAATLAGAVLASLWLSLSGLYPLRGILPLMTFSHSLIGVLEAALTAAIVATLARWRPDLAGGRSALAGRRDAEVMVLGGLGVALVIAAFLAPLASRWPDGLERTALALGFAGRAREGAPLPQLARLAPLVAGGGGTLLAAGLAWLAARGIAGRSADGHD